MPVEPTTPKVAQDEAILHQQYRRALSSFEGIILSQIDIKNRLGDRLNYSCLLYTSPSPRDLN